MEVTNRFKVFNLLQKVPEELRTEICNTVQEAVKKKKNIPKKKKCTKAKLSEEALQIAEKKEKQKTREKGKDIHN